MKQKIVQVDSFTNKPYVGNPAAVCVLDGPAAEEWMRAVAREMNLSETAFLHAEEDHYRLRWFTPKVEATMCGHATLASAHVLWEDNYVAEDVEIAFETLSGTLTARRDGDWIEMDFPAVPTTECEAPAYLVDAIGEQPKYCGEAGHRFLLEVSSPEFIRTLTPDMFALNELGEKCVLVTARSDDEPYAFVSRYFAHAWGIPEDPVTGSAHCVLGPYWQGRLDRPDFLAHQASPRGGDVRVTVKGDRVLLGGQAVTVMRGVIAAPDA